MTLQDLKSQYQQGIGTIGRSIDYTIARLTSYYKDNIANETEREEKISSLQTMPVLIGIIEFLQEK
jgi:hypothetical protein